MQSENNEDTVRTFSKRTIDSCFRINDSFDGVNKRLADGIKAGVVGDQLGSYYNTGK